MSGQNSIVIRITGDSGDGIQLVGEQLTISVALSGKDVRTLPDFPAEIRAPQGTVSGVSSFQLAIAESAIFTAGDAIDVLVALNPAAIKNSIDYLKLGGLLIVNEDSLTDKDWDRAALTSDFLDDCKKKYQVIVLPIIKNTLAAVENVEISHADSKKTKNFYILGVITWLFDLNIENCRHFINKKFLHKPLFCSANNKALDAGFNYAMTVELIKRQPYMLGNIERTPGIYRQITGVEAVSLAVASLAVMCATEVLVAGYPITPASAILEECANLNAFGVCLFQAEDEISAACACLGAAFAGKLAMTCTSGPGLDLKSESIGLAVASELPLVVLNVSRAGVSTGLPTKTGQSDLTEALYGRHGESPLPVLAAFSPVDCFYTIIEAFSIAIKYMTPVIVLIDAYLANSAEAWCIPDINDINFPKIMQNKFKEPYRRDDNLSRSWNIPGTSGFIHQLGGLEKSGDYGKVSYEADNHQQMVKIRSQKIENVIQDYTPVIIEGNVNAQILVIGWGSTYGSIREAILKCEQDGISIAFVHLRYIYPLPNYLHNTLKQYSLILVAELNSGQFIHELRAKYLINAKLIGKCDGRPFSSDFLVNEIKGKIVEEQA